MRIGLKSDLEISFKLNAVLTAQEQCLHQCHAFSLPVILFFVLVHCGSVCKYHFLGVLNSFIPLFEEKKIVKTYAQLRIEFNFSFQNPKR